MPFKAKKPCRFGEVDYTVGSLIPDEVIDPSQAKRLERSGYIEKQAVAVDTVPPAPLPSPLPPADKEPGEGDAAIYTVNKLVNMAKDDLVALAVKLNINTEEMTNKKQIAEAIIALQEETNAEKDDKEPGEGDA